MKNTLHYIVQLSLIAAFTLTASLRAEDKPAKREFADAAKELIGKVRGLIAEDRTKAFQEYAKGAQELAKEFPTDSRPLMMLSEASTLIEDGKLAKTLAEKAEKGILAILKKDPKDEGANAVLMRMADSAQPFIGLGEQFIQIMRGHIHETVHQPNDRETKEDGVALAD